MKEKMIKVKKVVIAGFTVRLFEVSTWLDSSPEMDPFSTLYASINDLK